MFELLVLEAPREHFIDDDLHLWVNDNWRLAITTFTRQLLVHQRLFLPDVLINALIDEFLHILTLVIEVKFVARLQR